MLNAIERLSISFEYLRRLVQVFGAQMIGSGAQHFFVGAVSAKDQFEYCHQVALPYQP